MATSVNNAFSEFISKYVNISNTISDSAKSSRDFLFQQISCLSNNGSFLKAAPEYNICFGSFARKTKISPLDDIDIIVGLNGSGLEIEGNQWNNINLKLKNDCSDKLLINAADTFAQYWTQNIYYLNSNKVKNMRGFSSLRYSPISVIRRQISLNFSTAFLIDSSEISTPKLFFKGNITFLVICSSYCRLLKRQKPPFVYKQKTVVSHIILLVEIFKKNQFDI